MKNTILTLSFLLVLNIQVFGQYRPLENYPSPVAGSLGEYGKIPVNMYSGTPQISIPLYELKDGELSLPIDISYNISSVKPNKRSGWVGLGWNLSAGGCIIRNVRGCYDEKQANDGKAMGFYSNYSKLQNVSNAGGLGAHAKNYTGDASPVYELTTDEYSFNFGNYSGSFYLNENGQWVVVSDHNIIVKFNPATGFRSRSNLRSEINTKNWSKSADNNRFFDVFTLVTPDGISYTFGGQNATEYSINYYNRNSSDLIPTSWFLTKIESPIGHEILLEYEPGLPTCEIQFSAFSSFTHIDLPDRGSLISGKFLNPGDINYTVNNTNGIKKLSGYLIFPVYIKSITTSYVKLNFHSGELYVEKEASPYKDFMDWAAYSEFSTPFSSTKFNPANQFKVLMPPNYESCRVQEFFGWRMLRAISIVPLEKSNVVPDNNDYIKTYYFEYVRKNRRKLTCIAERKGDYAPVEDWIMGGYNICGTTSMGRHPFYLTPEAVGYTPKEYHFSYNETKKFPRYIFASTDHWGYYNGFKEATEEGERSFSIPYTFSSGFYQSREPSSIIDFSKAETLKEIIYPTGGKTCFEYQQNGYNQIVPADLSTELVQEAGSAGGLCVSEIRQYDINDKLIQTKKYYYTDTIPSHPNIYEKTGILKYKKYYYMGYAFSNTSMSLCSEGGFLAFGTNQNDSHIVYPTVIEETTDESGTSNGFVRYKYSSYNKDIWGENHMDNKYLYAYNVSGYNYFTPSSSRSMERGKIMSEEYFNANGKLLKSVKYKYSKVNADSIKTPYQEDLIVNPNPSNFMHAYIAYMANTYTYQYLPSDQIETDYDPSTGQKLQSKEKSYEYNAQKLLKSEKTKSSDGIEYMQRYQYTGNYSYTASNDIIKSMIDMNKINCLVEEQTLVNKNGNWNLLKGKLIEYGNPDARIYKPVKEYVFESTIPLTDITESWFQTNTLRFNNHYKERIAYHKYDSYGNPVYITKDSIEKCVYVWSYEGRYPIAEIKHASYEEVVSAVDIGELLIEIMASSRIPDEYDLYSLNELRQFLPKAEITTYTYKPAIGLESIIDPRGIRITYHYDAFGRLQYIKDEAGKVINSYNYHFQEQ